jgi:DNA-binding IclR family transcriptional regulator
MSIDTFRGRALLRTFEVLTRLVAGPCDVADIARTLGVCRRTIHRDIVVLQAAGFPLVRVEVRGASQWTCLSSRWVDRLIAARREQTATAAARQAPIAHQMRRAS